jgi:hypothetical protein
MREVKAMARKTNVSKEFSSVDYKKIQEIVSEVARRSAADVEQTLSFNTKDALAN